MTHDYPDREAWARERRTVHVDEVPAPPRDVALYATPEEVAEAVNNLKHIARLTRVAVKSLEAGTLPLAMYEGGMLPPLATMRARYEAERERLIAAQRAEVEARPIDDAAWEREQQRRERVEASLAAIKDGAA